MARPKKLGLEYFPLDVNFYRDIKIRKLMRTNGGGVSITIYILLLCHIYETGYYMPWDEDLPFVLSEISGFDEETIQKTIGTDEPGCKSLSFAVFV